MRSKLEDDVALHKNDSDEDDVLPDHADSNPATGIGNLVVEAGDEAAAVVAPQHSAVATAH